VQARACRFCHGTVAAAVNDATNALHPVSHGPSERRLLANTHHSNYVAYEGRVGDRAKPAWWSTPDRRFGHTVRVRIAAIRWEGGFADGGL